MTKSEEKLVDALMKMVELNAELTKMVVKNNTPVMIVQSEPNCDEYLSRKPL